MSYPSQGPHASIPEEIAPFLKYSRQVATAIARNESMVGIMKPLFNRMLKKHPEIQETLNDERYHHLVPPRSTTNGGAMAEKSRVIS